MGQTMGQGYNLVSHDPDGPKAQGEGLTYNTKTTRLWRYRVRFQGAPPLTGTIRAASQAEAAKFLRYRHPNIQQIEELSRYA